MDLRGNWMASHRGDEVFPQQSVAKIWLAAAVLDQVDRGELSLEETVLIRPEDLSVFHQPVRALVIDDGRHVTTIAELISLTIAKSDNATTDILMRRLGGPEAVRQILERMGLKGLTAGEEQRELHPRIAGLSWRPEYANLGVFNQARNMVPESRRNALIEDYLTAPSDGATPNATVRGLAALKDGRLISPASTQHLLGVMASSNTGPRRLRGGLSEGWLIAHKTGTGPTRDGYAVGYNDVGLLTAPDGRTYAVAVYIRRTGAGLGERQRVIAEVSRAVVEHWVAVHAPSKPSA
jgi:beta-lactamase class A